MRLQRTYKIEAKEASHPKSVFLAVWSHLPRGKADGAMMALDSMYGGTTAYRMSCEQTNIVIREILPRKMPRVPCLMSDSETEGKAKAPHIKSLLRDIRKELAQLREQEARGEFPSITSWYSNTSKIRELEGEKNELLDDLACIAHRPRSCKTS